MQSAEVRAWAPRGRGNHGRFRCLAASLAAGSEVTLTVSGRRRVRLVRDFLPSVVVGSMQVSGREPLLYRRRSRRPLIGDRQIPARNYRLGKTTRGPPWVDLEAFPNTEGQCCPLEPTSGCLGRARIRPRPLPFSSLTSDHVPVFLWPLIGAAVVTGLKSHSRQTNGFVYRDLGHLVVAIGLCRRDRDQTNGRSDEQCA